MRNFLRKFKVNARIWALTVLSFIGMALIIIEYSTLVRELKAGKVSDAQFASDQQFVWVITAIMVALILFLAVSITASIMKPLRVLQAELTTLSDGQYDKPISDLDHEDGIAAMGKAAEVMRQKAIEAAPARRGGGNPQAARSRRTRAGGTAARRRSTQARGRNRA